MRVRRQRINEQLRLHFVELRLPLGKTERSAGRSKLSCETVSGTCTYLMMISFIRGAVLETGGSAGI